MAHSDTRIHQIELLLTLDYLLNYTDEFNPATQIDICEHARSNGDCARACRYPQRSVRWQRRYFKDGALRGVSRNGGSYDGGFAHAH